jgi:hypothetical protein
MKCRDAKRQFAFSGWIETSIGTEMANTNVLAMALPGSQPLRNAKYERYCRLRASAQPRIHAYRESGWGSRENDVAYINACRLERRPDIRDRIAYLTRQEEDLVAEKRQRIEERLWAMHEANLQDYFEQDDEPAAEQGNEINEGGSPKRRKRERPRLLTDLPPELAALVEDVTIDKKGRAIPKLYNKLQASKEMRAMLDIGRPSEKADLSRLSDAELVAQLADQAKALGIEIDLNYRFLQQPAVTKPKDK